MKNTKYLIFILSIFLGAGCSQTFLDKYPLDSVTNGTYWKTEAQLKAAISPCYDVLQKDIINLGEGCAETAYWGAISGGLNVVSGGRHLKTTGFPITSWWSGPYNKIYNCNIFLDNYDRANIDQKIKDKYAAEAKVLRVLNYFFLTTLFGDVTLITHVISAEDPVAYGPRTPRKDVVKWMLAELDWAAGKLGEDRPTGENLGRINKWGALALKARIALQNELWEDAALAAETVMNSGKYELYSDYKKLFQVEGNVKNDVNNKESIIYGLYVNNERMHNLSGELCKPDNYIRFNPAKTLVDAYLSTDGKPVRKGYEYKNSTTIQLSDLYPKKETVYADYWTNRDPRMAMTIIKPGTAWSGGDDGDAESVTSNAIFNLPRFTSLQNNNRNGANTLTGFYFSKYCCPVYVSQTNKDVNDIQILRYAEVLLIYAEAKLNVQGNLTQEQIDKTINKLRDRAKMHRMILTELKDWGMDLRTEVYRERRIEMALEGMRLFDVFRWKEGDRMGMAVTGPSASILINQLGKNPYSSNGIDENGDVIYEKASTSAGDAGRIFDPTKHYLWPIPDSEVLKNPNLGQNPGW